MQFHLRKDSLHAIKVVKHTTIIKKTMREKVVKSAFYVHVNTTNITRAKVDSIIHAVLSSVFSLLFHLFSHNNFSVKIKKEEENFSV